MMKVTVHGRSSIVQNLPHNKTTLNKGYISVFTDLACVAKQAWGDVGNFAYVMNVWYVILYSKYSDYLTLLHSL